MTYTPMIQQYLSIKAQYEDAFLFFRLGDFYEMFFEDAKKAARELEITLTSRDGGAKERIPMCGIPYHAAKQYIKVLVEKGFKIAICEQVEDPKQAKGVVKREVIQLITPGTVMDDQTLQPKQNNYLTSITSFDDGTYGFAVSDLTTGETKVASVPSWDSVIQEITAFETKEVVVAPSFESSEVDSLYERLNITVSYEDGIDIPEPLEQIASRIDQEKLRQTLGRLLCYLIKTQKRSLDHLQMAEVYTVLDFMAIDPNSRRNLELAATMRDKKTYGTLLWLLDQTKTAMGGRKLKQWIEKPLLNQDSIEARHSAVEAMIDSFFERETVRTSLSQVYDLERLVGRVAFGNVNARELIQLMRSLEQIPDVITALQVITNDTIRELSRQMDPCDDVKAMIKAGVRGDPPISVTEGGIIKDGYDDKLDKYRHISRNGKAWIAELEQQERKATGIKSLKVGFNKVFGYYIEVTKANIPSLPEGRYERKQTLANAERYITPELKEKEKLILEAEEKLVDLEYELFQQIREQVKAHAVRLQTLAKLISEIDVLQSFAVVSEEGQYVKPVFSADRIIRMKACRHPVIEKVMKNQTFVANDLYMDDDCETLLITGPNMGGKSTYMRQAALSAIMAQIGCFVPAKSAVLPIFDQIFTRIGAADDLVSGQSTFMVEMLEAEYALSHATQNSLILLDEIGRGTSTYDGIALAQAIVEFIHDHISAKTLFSTHYHELTNLQGELPRLRNVHVGAMEEDGKVVFLHKVMEGQADKSYGIHVAQLAGLPEALIERAGAILSVLESDQAKVMETPGPMVSGIKETQPDEIEQLTFFAEQKPGEEKEKLTSAERQAIKALKAIDLMAMTPMDAMNQLYTLQTKLKK
ncbi:DNA mismatch repair protein MutS [Scopulibacillus darangshiensis]|uniref:DNA mismatch repair protein MutS n=1 Tax=Scopulibacillus darangshiensis TaxID=442528 RepID=A0A4R2P8S3_9BACL|nr:DNA mismatch repair protein MutS [Scopulibacillus darangshiensis]TCP30255.1 DNA mismatch repair protein MutS [Scopulibacillus darangshiensis]